MTTLAFWLPVIFLFVAALLGAALKRRSRDACLKKFQGDLVFLRRTDGLWRAGVLRPFASGLELLYDEPRKEASGLVSSLVLHQVEVDKLTRIARPTPPEDTRAGADRRRILARIRNPDFFDRTRRASLNLYNMVRDAFGQSLNVIIGALTKGSNLSNVKNADKKLTEMSQSLTGVIPNAWEPVLETYRGRHVVVESGATDKPCKEWGILEDYSAKYLLIREVKMVEPPADEGAVRKGKAVQSGTVFDVLYQRSSALVRHAAPEEEYSH
jgi:hypothetical protein